MLKVLAGWLNLAIVFLMLVSANSAAGQSYLTINGDSCATRVGYYDTLLVTISAYRYMQPLGSASLKLESISQDLQLLDSIVELHSGKYPYETYGKARIRFGPTVHLNDNARYVGHVIATAGGISAETYVEGWTYPPDSGAYLKPLFGERFIQLEYPSNDTEVTASIALNIKNEEFATDSLFISGLHVKAPFTVDITQGDTLLAPGQVVSLIIGLDSISLGDFEDTIKIASNSRNEFKEFKIVLQGKVALPLRVDEIRASTLSIYPNPASQVLNIVRDSPESGYLSVEITDVSGTLFNIPVVNSEGVSKLDVSTLPSGVYFIFVGDSVKPFIKR